MATLLACALALAWPQPACSALAGAETAFDQAAIDRFVAGEMHARRLPGLALAIVHDDSVVYVRGYGRADDNGRPVTAHTPFVLASLSKSFTALAIMQLVEAGRVDLDAPVQHYLPWFRLADPTAAARITVRQLCDHTSGLASAVGSRFYASADTSATALEKRVRALATVRPFAAAGTSYAYCSANYAVLGMVVQVVSGESYERYVETHIFAPLGMTHSFTSQTSAQRAGLALGHRAWFGWPVGFTAPFNRGSIANGYLISSASDMARYAIAQLNGGRLGAASVLSPAATARMQAPQVSEELGGTSYAMGWHVGPVDGVPCIWHSGNGPNFQSEVILVPRGRWGIVLLSNLEDTADLGGGKRIRRIAIGIMDLLLARPLPAIASSTQVRRIYAAVLLLVGLQALGMVAMARRIGAWRTGAKRRPLGAWGWAWFALLPLVLHAVWAAFILVELPRLAGMPMAALVLFTPDLGTLLWLSGLVAGAWAVFAAVGTASALSTPAAPAH